MKIRKGFVVREVAGNTVAVPTENLINEFSFIINLNDSGKFIWDLLTQYDLTIDEIAEKYSEKYDVTFEEAKESSQKYINKLMEKHIIEQ